MVYPGQGTDINGKSLNKCSGTQGKRDKGLNMLGYPKVSNSKNLAGEPGFEPGLPGPEPGVLPLDYSPATPQKTKRIGQKIQSLLSNPLCPIIPPPTHQVQYICYLVSLCNEVLTQRERKYQLGRAWPAGIFFASTTRGQGYNIITDDGNETVPLTAPPTLRETIPRSADETDMKWPHQRCRNLLRRWHHAN